MQHGRKTNMNRHQKRPFAARSQQRPSNALRPEPQGSHNARRNYDRYVALAQAELQAGDRVAAKNNYKTADHNLRWPPNQEGRWRPATGWPVFSLLPSGKNYRQPRRGTTLYRSLDPLVEYRLPSMSWRWQR